MKRNILIWVLAAALMVLLSASCSRTMEEEMPVSMGLPEGTPITMRLDFGAGDLMNLAVSTKAEATPADEERIHDLYVMIFCDGEGDGHVNRGQKIYGRYFSYEHLTASLAALDASPNEGWWVENRTIPDTEHPENNIVKTRGAVKISTKVCSSAKLVVIANIDNGVCELGNESGFDDDMLGYLNSIRTLEQLQKTQVKLIQDVVHRKDLFLMMGMPEDGSGNPVDVNTGEMVWGSTSPSVTYNSTYQVKLRAVDAKVKFKVRINERNPDGSVKNEFISAAKAVYWEVDKTPDRCYLFSDYAPSGYPVGTPPVGTVYFNTEQAYFEGTVTEDGSDWYVFSFYMLESRFAAKAHAEAYHDREKKTKTDSGTSGYVVKEGESYHQRDDDHYVDNGEWIYAMPNAPYVKFDMILTLTPQGVIALGGNVEHALTSDTIFTVHLGDFSNQGFDDYNTYRSTCYTYNITIVNSGSIYAEVMQDQENQPGQEGYLLLTDDEIVNADCHYEYHAITFTYDPATSPEKFSWYVKTPFTSKVGGGPVKGTKIVEGKSYPTYDPHDTDGTLLDYRWVKFSINEEDPTTGYSTHRVAYPGNDAYENYKDWGVGEHGPWDGTAHPDLMDISQLIQYIFQETDKERETGNSDFKLDTELDQKVIRATIFIDEFYYEYDPRDESDTHQPDQNLWRQFVNAQPREMHILSKTVQSRDRMSDVIESSHSVIQQSIQTIYNVFEPDLRSIWGCEHLDEIKYTTVDGLPQSTPAGNWKYWPDGCSDTEKAGANTTVGKENGRLNSAYIWGLYSSQAAGGEYWTEDGAGKRYWKHFLKYEVNNSVPELRDDTESDTYGDDGTTHKYRGMAWSCLTRNRDNNGNGRIDEQEVRWYLASSQQLAGIWVGTESLSTSARLYQPADGEWRAHVVSSTNKFVSWAEEGGGATDIANDWKPGNPYYTWANEEAATVGESVRCIRNVGTYDGPEGVTDISYAPVTVEPDTYFTLERHSERPIDEYNCSPSVRDGEDNDDYFIFYFNRLNTNSIREYSPGELPYHDQMSLNNRVYKKMVTQPLSLDMPAYSEKLGEINNKVTQSGHNDYCPEGYRFPNHTEWLLMSLYLPGNYLQKGKNGESYSNVYPSRTYYDRGYYGSLRSDTEPWSTEKNKVGWLFSGTGDKAKMHCSPYNETIKRSRCVKDEDQTGVISGKIAVEGNEIYPGDKIPIDFKFSSTASTFTDATLTLWYTRNGFRTPYDLTSHLKAPTGLQYKGTQEIPMPSLSELGLDAAGLPYDMSLEVEFHNLNNSSGSHELNVSMVSPMTGSVDVKDRDYILPADDNTFTFNIRSLSHTTELSTASFQLTYTDMDGVSHTVTEGFTTLDNLSGKTLTNDQTIRIPKLTPSPDLSVPVTITATVTDTGGGSSNLSFDVPIRSHINAPLLEIPEDYSGNASDGFVFPVRAKLGTAVAGYPVSSMVLQWKKNGASVWSDVSLDEEDADFQTVNSSSLAGLTISTGSYINYRVKVVSDTDGTTVFSPVWSMYFQKYNYQANQTAWIEHFAGMSISSTGAFIQAKMNTSQQNKKNKGELLGVGTGSSEDVFTSSTATPKQTISAYWRNDLGSPKGYLNLRFGGQNPNTESANYCYNDVHYDPNDLLLLYNKNGVYYNGTALSWPSGESSGSESYKNGDRLYENYTNIINATDLMIGSKQGTNRSNSLYHFIRVVRQYEIPEP